MKNFPRLLLVACVFLLLLGGAMQWRRARVLAAQHAAAETELRSLREQLANAEQRARRAQKRVVLRQEDVLAGEAAAAPAVEPAPRPRMEAFSVPLDPGTRKELQRLHALHEKAALDSRFAALFKSLKLSPEKLERLKGLLVDRELAFADAMTAALEQGIDPKRDASAFQRAVAAAQADAERALAELLGPAGYAEYQQYRQTLPQRGVLSQLEQRLSYTDQPLSAAQSAEMLRILAATTPSPQSGAADTADSVFVSPAGAAPMGGAPISDAAIAQAQGVLSEAQLQALREIQQAQLAHREAMKQFPGPQAGQQMAVPIGRRSGRE